MMLSEAGNRIMKLEAYDKDTYDVVKWLEKGQKNFAGTVHLPPYVSMGVKDMATVVESCFQKSHLLV